MKTEQQVSDRSADVCYTPECAAERVKRMIFVASTYFQLIGVNNPSREELDNVNSLFRLVHDNRALKFPAAIGSLIWRSSDLADVFKRYLEGALTISAAAMEVLPKIPRWMKYGDNRALKDDLREIFECARKR